ncbi:MAG: FAD-binding oxidoreductase [Actinobacteria bacterium]|nr:FAD-binding oxidoreductase [Actinomycetota bacterium]
MQSGEPTPPISLGAAPEQVGNHLGSRRVELDARLLRRLGDACDEVLVDDASLVEASRDWWPLAMIWALSGEVGARAAALARPATAAEVCALLAVCDEARLPVTAAAGRSGVCGASVPLHGGVVLDLSAMSGIVDVDAESLVLDVLPGTFGTWLEDTLRAKHGATLGHWPQSIDLSTVGGWLACRGAGQMSTRYGKIEDMVVGLDVALADGRHVRTGGAPRAAVGPDLNQLFVGSEGTLGIITGARLRLHPAPAAERRAAYAFESFAAGNDACRRIVQRGATPAVLRLYDAIESDRSYQTGAERNVLLVMDEGDALLVDATMAVVAEVCAETEMLDVELVERWMGHRNDVSALEALITRDYVVDTMEIAAPWSRCGAVYEAATAAIRAVPGALVASAHQSHSYPDGACLYFTFAGQPAVDAKDAFYEAAWDAGTRAVLANGGALSHHHGVGLNRSRFVRDALGPAFDVLVAVKQALDPNGILNPGKLGLPDPWA